MAKGNRSSYIESLPDRVFDGYVYRQGRPLKDGARRLICSRAESDACNAQGKLSATDDFSYVEDKSVHSHERDPDSEYQARFMRDLYIATKHEFRNLQKIYNEISLIHQEVATLISFDKIKRRMQTWQENRVLPKITSLDDLKSKLQSERFKNINLHNDGKTEIEFLKNQNGQESAIIFVDKVLFAQLETSTLFIQSTEQLFEGLDRCQLTSISTKFMDHILPIVWIVEFDKTEENCKIMLRKILSFKETLSPVEIFVDFDHEYWTAINADFPETIVNGTFLAYCKIIMNAASCFNLDLKDDLTLSVVSKIVVISLLPTNMMVDALREIVRALSNEEFRYFNELFEYYNTHWLTNIKTENYSFYNDPICLWKNTELILQSMTHQLQQNNSIWKLIEQISSSNFQIHFHLKNLNTKGDFKIHSRKGKNIFTGVKNCNCITKLWKEIAEGALTSTEFVNRTGNQLKPIIRNLLLSNVRIPVNFKLLTLFTDGAIEPLQGLSNITLLLNERQLSNSIYNSQSDSENSEVDTQSVVTLADNLIFMEHDYNSVSGQPENEESSDFNIVPELISMDND